MASIALEHVQKSYPTASRPSLADLSLDIADGERLAIVGPSGSGKSTVLRLVAGLDQPTAGRILIGGEDVTFVPPESRDVAMVFQSYALYPHMTVRANLSFGLRMRGLTPAAIDARVLPVAASLSLGPLLGRTPAALSGGERQRVALGRALVRHPRVFLFDEPLSNLDPRLRGDTRAELAALHQRLQTTMVYVTHDQEEAMTLGQRVAVLREGRLEQLATPQELYACPQNRFVASFIGSPPMNLLEGTEETAAAAALTDSLLLHERLTIGIRPSDIALVDKASGALHGVVEIVEPLGHSTIVHVRTARYGRVVVLARSGMEVGLGAEVGLTLDTTRVHLFGPDGRRIAA